MLKINQNILSDILNKLSSIIPSDPIIPACDSVLFKLEDDSLFISATDIKMSVSMQTKDFTSKKFNPFAVEHKMIFSIVKSLSNEEQVSIKQKKSSIEIVTESGGYNIPTIPEEEYINHPKLDAASSQSVLRPKLLVDSVNNCVNFSDKAETNRLLEGTYFDAENNAVVSCNGTVIIENQYDYKLKENFKLPDHASRFIAKHITNEGFAEVSLHGNIIVFNFPEQGIWMSSGLFDAEFPNYTTVLDQKVSTTVLVESSELCSVLERSIVLAASTSFSSVEMVIQKDGIVINVDDENNGYNSSEKVTAETKGTPLNICVNGKLLLSLLKTLKSEYIEMGFISFDKVVFLTPLDNENLRATISPIVLI